MHCIARLTVVRLRLRLSQEAMALTIPRYYTFKFSKRVKIARKQNTNKHVPSVTILNRVFKIENFQVSSFALRNLKFKA